MDFDFSGITVPGFATLEEFIVNALNIAIGAAAIVCVAILIGSGYMYITASGDEAKVEKANKSLTYAVVGLLIAFVSVLLVNFVLKKILGVDETLTMIPFILA